MGIVLVGATVSFFFPFIGAYKWYRGERHTIEDFSVCCFNLENFDSYAQARKCIPAVPSAVTSFA